MVRLRVDSVYYKKLLDASFNSNMVRLRDETFEITVNDARTFQFQYGAVKRIWKYFNR